MKFLYLLLIIWMFLPWFSLAGETVIITATVAGCGDGVVAGLEECDGNNLNGATCVTKGFNSGTLSCSSTCYFNTARCDSGGNSPVFFSGFGVNPNTSPNILKISRVDYFQGELVSGLKSVITELKGLIENISLARSVSQLETLNTSKTTSILKTLNGVKLRLVSDLRSKLAKLKDFFVRVLVRN